MSKEHVWLVMGSDPQMSGASLVRLQCRDCLAPGVCYSREKPMRGDIYEIRLPLGKCPEPAYDHDWEIDLDAEEYPDMLTVCLSRLVNGRVRWWATGRVSLWARPIDLWDVIDFLWLEAQEEERVE